MTIFADLYNYRIDYNHQRNIHNEENTCTRYHRSSVPLSRLL